MNVANSQAQQTIKYRRHAQDNQATVLADIYREDTNIAIWQRALPSTLEQTVDRFLAPKETFQTAMTVTPENALNNISEALATSDFNPTELSENMAELVAMFCCLFELERAGLRFKLLNNAMCPRFHVDRVPCRLVTTYQGVATQWLPHNDVDRSKLGLSTVGMKDEESGLFHNKQAIQHLESGDVALLKGELWEGNENAGLVHRSPAVSNSERRLLMTLDFAA